MKKIISLFVIALLSMEGFFLIICPSVSSDGISLWPPSITIDINDWNYGEEIHQKIQINNLNHHDINASAVVDNAPSYRRKESYSDIPDLSWIRIEPDTIYIPAGGSRFVDVFISIPDEEKHKHYNGHWEVWLVFSDNTSAAKEGGAVFQIALAVRCYINTPSRGSRSEVFVFPFLLLIVFIGVVAVAELIIYLKKRRFISSRDKTSIFYYKKKN